jgi:hemoglobin/transferrin/lactoferrin receptor protein
MKKYISLGLCLGVWGVLFCQSAWLQGAIAELPPNLIPAQINRLVTDDTLGLNTQDTINSQVLQLGEVVVSATRWSQASRNVPFRVATAKPSDVALQNPQTAADLIGMTGEVFIQKSQQGGGSPMIRGFATNRLLIAVDGIRMNTAIFRSGNLQNIISLDPFAMQSAEVLFGPGSVMYGSDAVGGVMNFTTLSPKLANESPNFATGNAALRYSSANEEMTAHLDLNAAWKKLALTTSITHSDFGDLRMGTNGPDEYLRTEYVQRMDGKDVVVMNPDPLVQRPTGYQQINLMQKLRYQPSKNWDITYGFHYSTTTDYDRYDRLLRYREGLPRSAEWRYGPQLWTMNNLTVSHKASSGIYDEAKLILAQQHFEESRTDRDFNKTERRTRLEKVNAWSLNLDLQKAIGKRHSLFYGLEAIHDDVKSSGTNEDMETHEVVKGPARYPQADWSSYSAYVAWQFQASQKLTLFSGARYNRFGMDAKFDTAFYPFPFTTAEQWNGALTGNFGAVLHPSPSLQLRANLSTGFRSPNVDDMGKVFDSVPGSVTVPNPNLGPEYAYNAELGIAKEFGKLLRLDVTGFYTLLDHALVLRNFMLNGQDSILYDGEMSQVQAMQNAAIATVKGIQVGLEIRLAEGCTLSSHLTWQEGEEELDDGSTAPLRHAAPLFGITRLGYTKQQFRMEASFAFSGQVSNANLAPEEKGKGYLYAVDKNGNPYSPSWYTLNFRAMYQLSELWAISGGLENITDQRYRPYSSGIAAAGRNFVLSLRAKF